MSANKVGRPHDYILYYRDNAYSSSNLGQTRIPKFEQVGTELGKVETTPKKLLGEREESIGGTLLVLN